MMAPSSLLLLIIAIFFTVPMSCTAKRCTTRSKMFNKVLDVGKVESDKIRAIQALSVGTWKDCARACCLETECEFLSFQMAGSSRNGNNCYLISCGGDLKHCQSSAVHQYGFISMGILPLENAKPSSDPMSGVKDMSDMIKEGLATTEIPDTAENPMDSADNKRPTYSAATESPINPAATRSPILVPSGRSKNTTLGDYPPIIREQPIQRCSGMNTRWGCFNRIWVGVIGMILIFVVVVTSVVVFFVVKRVIKSRREAMDAEKKARRQRRFMTM